MPAGSEITVPASGQCGCLQLAWKLCRLQLPSGFWWAASQSRPRSTAASDALVPPYSSTERCRTSFCRRTSGAAAATLSSICASRSARRPCRGRRSARGPRLGVAVDGLRARDGDAGGWLSSGRRRLGRLARASAGQSGGGASRGSVTADVAGRPVRRRRLGFQVRASARAAPPGRGGRAADCPAARRAPAPPRASGAGRPLPGEGRPAAAASAPAGGAAPGRPGTGAAGSWRAWVTGRSSRGFSRGVASGGGSWRQSSSISAGFRAWRRRGAGSPAAGGRPPAAGGGTNSSRSGGRLRTACTGMVGASGSVPSGTSAGRGAWRTRSGRAHSSARGSATFS